MLNKPADLHQMIGKEVGLETPAQTGLAENESVPCGSQLRAAIAAISLANLCLINSWFASHFDADFGYYNKLPVTRATMLATLANLLLLSFAFWSCAQFASRTRHRFVR